MTYEDFKDLLALILLLCTEKNLQVELLKVKLCKNKELRKDLYKPIIRKLEKRKVPSSFKYDI